MANPLEARRVRVDTDGWHEPLAFAQATRVGSQLWIAGQVAVEPDGTPVGIGDPGAHAERVWQNPARGDGRGRLHAR